MTTLTAECRISRLRLQAPHELTAEEARLLEEHVCDCRACAEFRSRQAEMDHRIERALDLATDHSSVHRQVLQRLHQKEHVARTGRARRRRRSVVWGINGLLAAAAAAIALFTPTFPLQEAGERVTPLRAAFRVVRYEIGFPIATDRGRAGHLLAGAWGRVYESWNDGDSWSALGPLPPGLIIRALAVDDSQPNRYLVATKHSVFVSTDRGRHWSIRADALPGARNMFLLQDPRTPSVFYLGPSVLWKSANHGESWSPAGRGKVFAPDGIQSLALAPDGTLITGIWAGGVARSTNGGVTWQRRARGLRRNVMDVAAPSSTNLWAATDRGLYHSGDGGTTWRHSGPGARLFATSVLAGPGWLLAGGNGGLYRSEDGGRHWSLAMVGLPLDPYIAGLAADPFRPNRVYASLNMDGLFRSDDAGLHWTPVDNGLQVNGEKSGGRGVLFIRAGTLWITDSWGTDPGVLTVDQDVRLAELSPDGAAVAYLAGDTQRWALRVLGAGGSAARTLIAGRGAMPSRLLWSPNSSAIALNPVGSLTVVTLDGSKQVWPLDAHRVPLGWTPDGRSLLAWDRPTGEIIATFLRARDRLTDAPYAGPYPAMPTSNRTGTVFAFVWRAELYVTGQRGRARPVATLARGCAVSSWLDDGSSLLLHCPGEVEVRAANGRLRGRTRMSSRPWWAPGSQSAILTFQDGSLWRWQIGHHLERLVRNAQPATHDQL